MCIKTSFGNLKDLSCLLGSRYVNCILRTRFLIKEIYCYVFDTACICTQVIYR